MDGSVGATLQHTAQQMTTIRILRAVCSSEFTDTSLSARLGRIARMVYFRNMDVTPEDIEYLSQHLSFGSSTGEDSQVLGDKKQQLQTKIWGKNGSFIPVGEEALRHYQQARLPQYV